ncbi:MAG: hypothetical protein GY869_18335, partial [Planctomycetes bacterium]|nr:hypothetical protein [Planctomycetota bacterium]
YYGEEIAGNLYDELYRQIETKDPTPGAAYLAEAQTLIQLSIIHSNLMGMIHARANIARQETAARKLRGDQDVEIFDTRAEVKVVIDEQTIDSLLDDAGTGAEYITELEAGTAEMVSTRARLDFYDRMDALTKILAENVPTGLGYRDFLDRIGRSKAMDSIGLAGEKPYYIETVYRTNYGTAHSAGRWKSAQESPLVVMLRYESVDDNRRTPICAQLAGTVKKKDDPFWSTYNPLNHFSCRSTVSELTETYVEINKIKETADPSITADHPKDFQTNPGESDAWMKPSKGMKKRLKEFEN